MVKWKTPKGENKKDYLTPAQMQKLSGIFKEHGRKMESIRENDAELQREFQASLLKTAKKQLPFNFLAQEKQSIPTAQESELTEKQLNLSLKPSVSLETNNDDESASISPHSP